MSRIAGQYAPFAFAGSTMSGGKIIPIIERGDKAVRDELYGALIASAKSIDAKLDALIKRVDAKLAELETMQKEEGGRPTL